MRFARPAPGNLTLDSGSYYMDWKIDSGNYGMSDSAAADMVEGYLESSQGWERAGIEARQLPGAPVTFKVVLEATCSVPEYACTHYGVGTAFVELEYPRIAAGFGRGTTNHEAGHAFFYATHEGSGSIMNGGSPDGWPTDADIDGVVAWLGDPAGGGTGTGGAYWFPGDLEHYVTRWALAGSAEVRLNATVLSGVAGASLAAVWGDSRDGILGTRRSDLTTDLDASERGVFTTGWLEIPEGARTNDAWVGVVVRRETADLDISNLLVGLAEVQTR